MDRVNLVSGADRLQRGSISMSHAQYAITSQRALGEPVSLLAHVAEALASDSDS